MNAFVYLLNNRNSATNVPVHPAAGVYAIFALERGCLPGIRLPSGGLVYIGLSSNLEQRNHFNATNSGFHSPRRSIGAILKEQLNLTAIPRGTGVSATNYRNFRFTADGEERLTRWMQSNLEYAIYPYDGDVIQLETRLIRENQPPLNLNKWRNPQKQKIGLLRRLCRAEANSL